MKIRVGILGGTFNPIHLGHIKIVKLAKQKLNLDKIILIPTGTPPHKENEVTSASHRYNMTVLATKGIPFITVSDIEVKRKGYSYTVDTIKSLKKELPNTNFFYIIGADNIGYIKDWKNAKELLKGLNIVCLSRMGYDMNKDGSILEKDYGAKLSYIEMDEIPISSTKIRNKLKQNEDVTKYLDDAVLSYIKDKGLYGLQNR